MKILTVVVSAGLEPWVSIEENAQIEIIQSSKTKFGPTLWFRGDPNSARSIMTRLQNSLRLGVIKARIIVSGSVPQPVLAVRQFQAFFAVLGWLADWPSRFRSGHEAFEEEGHIVQTNMPSEMGLSSNRILEMYRYVLDRYEFDFLYRVSSTVIPVPNTLHDVCMLLPKTRVFGGRKHSYFGKEFLSGAALLFSRDVLRGITQCGELLDRSVYEDVAVSELVASNDLAEFYEVSYVNVGFAPEPLAGVGTAGSTVCALRFKTSASITREATPVVSLMRKYRNLCDQ